MMHPWPELAWWDSGERQVVEEKIDDLERKGIVCNPASRSLYTALRTVSLRDCRVAILGQDPYPTSKYATGTAFSIPKEIPTKDFPPTLRIILGELHSDLHYDLPDHGDLHRWTSQGVLLWNAIPSCQSGKPLSNDWEEWAYLTREIVQKLSDKGVVFAFLGSVASRFDIGIDLTRNRVIRTSHPSPRGNKFGKTPFSGSRPFSTINAKLQEMGQEPINWELKDVPPSKSVVQRPSMGGSNVLRNITGAQLGGLKRTATSPNIYTSLEF
jgi:uracil-DNA glycosylase